MKKGMVLIEFVVVVLVLGLLAGLAIPNYRKIQARVYQQIMVNTLRELARYERYSYLDSGRFFPKRIYDESFEVIVLPDGKTIPEGVSLQTMLFRLPQQRKHIFYIYWFAPLPQKDGSDDNGGDEGEGDDGEGDEGGGGDDGEREDDGDGRGDEGDDDEGDDDGNGRGDKDDRDDDDEDDNDDDDDDDDNGHGRKTRDSEDGPEETVKKESSKSSLMVAAPEAYFCIYAYASRTKGNDLDGDSGEDVWYVDSYTDEPFAVSNDLK